PAARAGRVRFRLGGATERCGTCGGDSRRQGPSSRGIHAGTRRQRELVRACGKQPRSVRRSMNLIIGSPWWLIALLFLALVAAALEDGLRLRISNLTCAAVVIGALVAAGFHGFSSALWQNVVVGV